MIKKLLLLYLFTCSFVSSSWGRVLVSFDDLSLINIAKFYLYEGRPMRAEYFLNSIHHAEEQIMVLKSKYLSLAKLAQKKEIKKSILDDISFNSCHFTSLASFEKGEFQRFRRLFQQCYEISPVELTSLYPLLLKTTSPRVLEKLADHYRTFFGDLNTAKIWLKIHLFHDLTDQALKRVEAIWPSDDFLNDHDIRSMIAMLYLKKNEFEKSKELLDPLDNDFSNYLLGKIFLLEGDKDQAYFHFKKSTEKNPLNTESLRNLILLSGALDKKVSYKMMALTPRSIGLINQKQELESQIKTFEYQELIRDKEYLSLKCFEEKRAEFCLLFENEQLSQAKSKPYQKQKLKTPIFIDQKELELNDGLRIFTR